MKASVSEVELEYPIQINGQDVIVRRYVADKADELEAARSLSFYSGYSARLNHDPVRGKVYRDKR